MALAPIRVVVLGTVAFLVFWTLAVFPSFKLLPIGRTAGAVAGAVLTVVFQVDSPSDAYGAVDLSVLGLLFGTMVVGVYLERADLFRYLGDVLSWKSKGGWDLLIRVCVMSALASALFTNDTCCLVLTEFVLKLCRQKNLPPKPFLLALASSANIGSSATPIGNPQNLVIAVQSGISFGRFLLGLYKSMILGVIVNIALLLLMYWKQLSPVKDLERGGSSHPDNTGTKDQLTASPWTPFHSGNFATSTEIFHDSCSEALNENNQSPPIQDAIHNSEFEKAPSDEKTGDVILSFDSTTGAYQANEVDMSRLEGGGGDLKSSLQGHQNSLPVNSILREHKLPLDHNEIQMQRSNPEQMSPSRMESSLSLDNINLWKRRLWKCAVYFVTIAMLAALLYGLDLSWTALTAAVTLMALDFCDAGPSLEKVSYLLLVFFAGMFITVDGFNTTGIPGTFWDTVEPNARINSVSGVVILSLVVIVLSNVASNVPTVLLLGSRVSQSAASTGASVTRAWLILAWTSTVAGNLTLVGSAANLIVSEQARKTQFLGYELTFGSHIIFGFPSTLIVTAVGLPFIRA